ncbi:MAG: glycine cleavage system protein GcvH [Proteobacteria bacterium]|nr:glycine cleavage system protein GcvH [Pseudomonadota bacterium]MDA1132848.1 glycine cleavage system protein GcvH [Pseudomonadota bacterium]
MSEKRFTRDHEWIEVDGGVGTVGITAYAQEQLGDVVFVELPAPGKTLTRGGEAAVVESVKAASEVYAPVSGEVTAVNEALAANPGLVNEAAESGGWFLKVRLSDPSELEDMMDEAAYRAYTEDAA